MTQRNTAFCCLAFLIFLEAHHDASALPAFARKYRTSCTTCHVGFPKLNAFGEAFRNNGYQFPGHMDPEYVKEDPVPLGADTSFPKEVWPGSIPGSAPIALLMSGSLDYDPTEKQFTFGDMGTMVTLLTGGTIGEDLSFWGQVDASNAGITVGRVFLRFSNMIGDKYAFNMRVGAFEPAVLTVSNRRTAFADYWILSRTLSTDMGWSLERTQKGLEFNGIVSGRMSYTAGLVEGYGLTHKAKDLYGRVMVKLGGMRLDGIEENRPVPQTPQPWRDNSVALGAFAYSGNALIGTAASSQENTFTMAGAEFNAWYDRFNLYGSIGSRKDDNPFLGFTNRSVKSTVGFCELDLVAHPWIIPCVRFETWSSSRLDAMNMIETYTDKQVKIGAIVVVRPNVTCSILTGWVQNETSPMDMSMPMPATGHVHGQLSETGQVMVHLMVGF